MLCDLLDHVSSLLQVGIDAGERTLNVLAVSLVVVEERIELAAAVCLCGSDGDEVPP